MAGYFPYPLPDFISDLAVVKEVTIEGAFGVTARAYERAINLIESGREPIESVHTHDFSPDHVELAIQTLAGEAAGQARIHSCLRP